MPVVRRDAEDGLSFAEDLVPVRRVHVLISLFRAARVPDLHREIPAQPVKILCRRRAPFRMGVDRHLPVFVQPVEIRLEVFLTGGMPALEVLVLRKAVRLIIRSEAHDMKAAETEAAFKSRVIFHAGYDRNVRIRRKVFIVIAPVIRYGKEIVALRYVEPDHFLRRPVPVGTGRMAVQGSLQHPFFSVKRVLSYQHAFSFGTAVPLENKYTPARDRESIKNKILLNKTSAVGI